MVSRVLTPRAPQTPHTPRAPRTFALLATALAAGCTSSPSDQGPIIPPGPPPIGCDESFISSSSNPIDRAICSSFTAASYHPLLAGDDELCTRLSIDLLGVRRESVRLGCSAADVDGTVQRYQDTLDYRHTQRRFWADRFSYTDAIVEPLAIKELDALVDRLYKGELTYGDFAVQSLSHPAFVGRYLGFAGQHENVVRAAFRIFLGRPATRPEAIDLVALWRPWTPGYISRAPNADFSADRASIGYYATVPAVDPTVCEAGVRSCTSDLLGDATLAFPREGDVDPIEPGDLSPAQWEALRAPGRLFVKQKIFWEAAVDGVMQHYLGYDLGAINPRARQDLVAWFQQSGDLRALERLVLTSVAYRQTAKIDPANPRPAALENAPFAHGPTKPMTVETWLHSVGVMLGVDLGDCDWRYPNLPDMFGGPNPELDALLEDIYPRLPDGMIDASFRARAAAMGGCPGQFDFGSNSVRERTTVLGLITAVAQEETISDLCFGDGTTDSEIPGILPREFSAGDTRPEALRAAAALVLERALGVPPSSAELDEVLDAAADGCPDCTVGAIARDLCSGLIGAVEYLEY